MDGIEIRITGATPLEALAKIGAFGMHCLANEDVCAAAARIFNDAAKKEKAAQLEAAKTPEAAPDPTTGATGAPSTATQAGEQRNDTPADLAGYATPAPTPATTAQLTPPAPATPAPTAMPSPVTAPATPVTPAMPAAATAPILSQNALPGQTVIASPTNPPAVPTGAPTYTLDDITRAGADFIVRNPDKQEMLNSLFPQFGITTLAELRTEQMGPFATAMRAMGVNI